MRHAMRISSRSSFSAPRRTLPEPHLLSSTKKVGRDVATVFGALAAMMIAPAPPNADATASVHTYIAVFGQLYTSSPSFSGRARFYQQPRSFAIEVNPDSVLTFVRLRWQHWGSRTAIAHGFARTCAEGGPEGNVCHTGSVRLLADQFAPCADGNQYERLRAYGVPELRRARGLDIPVASEACGVKG